MRLRSVPLGVAIFCLVAILAALTASVSSFAALRPSTIPDWLQRHVGDGEGQISQVVLERARALYLKKVSEGSVSNPCYFAMDATRPGDLGNSVLGQRYYVICEAKQLFRAFSAGHGGGRNLKGVADFSNGRRCAKNFGNAMDSELTAGGAYMTAETKTSFKGYYRVGAQNAVFMRSFIQFDGEGEAANARQRVIGGHPAALLRGMCMRKDPSSSYADHDGLVPFGKLVNYAGGRSNGCTSWSPADAEQIIPIVKNNPTTLYIYPESRDIAAVARAKSGGQALSAAGVYWNASCLKEIGTPKFWPKKMLEPIIAQYKKDHPAPPPQPVPMCKD
ncbi:hypothetical protein RFM41_31705 [Mesorhizobium sp. VK25A]|uniref:L,D-transpeptidase catalytic domain n=1 Tax=Mesorhizobium vachelliae TaxID=3072309 RepID=A0ABU5AEE7_9HYPH|nr:MULTISPECIES: hypothetical protein [unclassified Mesorhizobium]MDX8535656.1 hypothetical protein [Mesorhizobium sp. VK25D]MDX8548327.1 hypothetical protein [Mesorhizobium sp. VK25A]